MKTQNLLIKWGRIKENNRFHLFLIESVNLILFTRKREIAWSVIPAGHVRNPNRWQSSRPVPVSTLYPIADTLQSKYHLCTLGSYKNARRAWQMWPGTRTSLGRLERIHLLHLKSILKRCWTKRIPLNKCHMNYTRKTVKPVFETKVAHCILNDSFVQIFSNINEIKHVFIQHLQRRQWMKMHHLKCMDTSRKQGNRMMHMPSVVS